MAYKKTNYNKYLEKRLQSPRHISGLLNAVLEEGDKRVFLLTMRDIIKANGGFAELASKINVTREHLYYIFSEKGNPTFENIQSVLRQYRVQLGIKVLKKAA